MKYEYAEVYKAEDCICFFDGEREVKIGGSLKTILTALNELGQDGWHVVQVVTSFNPSGFSGYSEVDHFLIERIKG